MILSVGELLADMIGEADGDSLRFQAFCGGAPFNLAVNARQAGAKVGFLGRVGCDPVGKFLIGFAQKAGLDQLIIQQDEVRKYWSALRHTAASLQVCMPTHQCAITPPAL